MLQMLKQAFKHLRSNAFVYEILEKTFFILVPYRRLLKLSLRLQMKIKLEIMKRLFDFMNME